MDILVVEDDGPAQVFLESVVEGLGHRPNRATSVAEARRVLKRSEVDLVLLDRVLKKGIDGLRLCLQLKKDPGTRSIPVIVLSDIDKKAEEIKSYRFGADLVLPKGLPIADYERYIRGFLARLPYRTKGLRVNSFGDVKIDLGRYSVRIGGTAYDALTPHELLLLDCLVSSRGRSVSRAVILKRLWDYPVRDKAVDVLVSRLRKVLGAKHASRVESVRSYGYRFRFPSASPAR